MNQQPNNNEQWLLQGDCRACRRGGYCSKPCTRYKKNANIALRQLIAEKMDEMTGGALSEIIERTGRDYLN